MILNLERTWFTNNLKSQYYGWLVEAFMILLDDKQIPVVDSS